MLELTCENRKIIKKYYVNYYLNIVDANGRKTSNYKKIIEEKMENSISKYFDKNIKSRPSQYLTQDCIYYIHSQNMKIMHTKDIYLLAQKDEKYIKNLINIYTNKIEMYVNCFYHQSDSKEVIKRINDKVIKKIENYNFKENSFENFSHIISNLYKREFNILGMYVSSKSEISKEEKYIKFENKFLDMCCELKTNYLSNEEFEKYKREFYKYHINNNFCPNNTMYEKIGVLKANMMRVLNNGDSILMSYYYITGEGFNHVFNYYYKKYVYVIKDVLKECNLYSPVKEYIIRSSIYSEKISYLIKNYPKTTSNMESILKTEVRKYINNKYIKKKSSFNKEIARNGDNFERENELLILLEDYSYFIDEAMNKRKYYDYEYVIRNILEEKFINTCNAYVHGKVNKPVTSYLSLRFEQISKNLNKKTLNKTYHKHKKQIEVDKEKMIKAYIEYNNLLQSEEYEIRKYIDKVCEVYIENGLYKNHQIHFIKALSSFERSL